MREKAPRLGSLIYRRVGKRIFDIVFSATALILLMPALLILAFIVKRDGGPAFFGHKRIGRDGKPFTCWKIRTMVVDAEKRLNDLLERDPVAREQWQREFKLDNDPRITALGQFLRRSSLDELPQFWNVLLGDMSVVGPRPVTKKEVELYGKHARTVQSVRPGVTGLWQVSGRNAISYSSRVRLDVHYARNASFVGDLAIVLWTVTTMLKRTGK
ncbi:sugar transferase [Rhodobacter aestuarii]|uniref:sugar transferase n=1 Tax=Rhodobacter aestuarii TaxID=453582 RepID=UPI00158E32E5|nr:sugar transferase [Rhodobacter aestuarii]